ncbi:DUF423 domain-containing protein [Paenibacillus polymyxa]|uniref:DUF423 domain-containing protein n=1 Tax=Paenibacillus TaxID=44249 RepID=UPI0004DF1BE6|nr:MULTISPECIES: DUF423 domain-containing protein [Paenibacillus]KAF6657572.1 DUF423 domain-containing protein [Paenibacillus sp. EKM301P]KJD37672.1 membrane protein [Paenibacillus polymyxa]MBY7736417.1 DUF423 domain-containing protein [Paenibacillus polymyxa]MCJ1218749.1 DUF423 domain-containing protein [Paenibacillus polymyxa]MEE4561501.1 DUF423 domain-containing protein [Paenibacillus polymyxa]
MQRRWIMVGSIMMMLAVAIGAFGAHIVKARIDADALAVYETAVKYHMIHAVGLLIIALAAGQWGPSTRLRWAARLLFTGIILFSGSLYVLSLTGIRVLGAITPLGGVCFIAGWILLAWAAAGLKKEN